MTDSFVTQCPHCQTSFRVNHQQLSVARGVVRCGACLQVFNAARQLLEQSGATREATQPEPEVPAAAAEPAPPAPTPVEPQRAISQREWQALEREPLHDDLDLDQALANFERRHTPSGRRSEDRPTQDTGFSARRDDDPLVDTLLVGGFSATEPEPGQPELTVADAPGVDTAPLDEPEVSIGSDTHDREPLGVGANPVEPALGQLTADELEDDDRYPTPQSPSADVERNEPRVREIPLLDLEDEALQLQWRKSRPRWGRRLLWLLLVVLAALALAGQYVFYHFDELARQDRYRPWFQQACPVIGCKVPSRVDIDRIRSSNLVVRSHPDFSGALVVDAILYNRAAFAQPFPLLELRFADLNGQLIASRRFKPSEYLPDDMLDRDMPPQTPIHIALDILDPGPKAVNYSLSFRSPE